MPDARIYTAAEKVKALAREISFRRRVYARRVEERKMTKAQMDHEIGIFESMLADYEKLAAGERLL